MVISRLLDSRCSLMPLATAATGLLMPLARASAGCSDSALLCCNRGLGAARLRGGGWLSRLSHSRPAAAIWT